jgi:ABC-type bacteriocin/lantibiotic exporter with double-glycine peptidase domain
MPYKGKDIDGGWHEYDLQQKDESCGPACVKMLKEHEHNKKLGEEYLRGLIAMFRNDVSPAGQSAVAQASNTALHDWTMTGTDPEELVKALKANPQGISKAREVKKDVAAHLGKTTRNHPAIVGWWWEGGGGHWTVCVGPTKKDKNVFIVLDPILGVQHLALDDKTGKKWWYHPVQNPAHPKGFFTEETDCGVIVTY